MILNKYIIQISIRIFFIHACARLNSWKVVEEAKLLSTCSIYDIIARMLLTIYVDKITSGYSSISVLLQLLVVLQAKSSKGRVKHTYFFQRRRTRSAFRRETIFAPSLCIYCGQRTPSSFVPPRLDILGWVLITWCVWFILKHFFLFFKRV